MTTPSNLAIHIEGLSKTYKTGFWFKPKITHALNNLTLDVYEKEAFGLLGLNGAGKTTAIKIILGFLAPTAGSVQVLGGKISDREVRNQIGYLSELPYFSRQHTGRELLEYFGSLHGFSGSTLQHRVDEVLELVRMSKASREKVSGYSKGMLQRIGIGQALIGKPKLLICDEPMSGLDPVGYKEMRDIFIDLKKWEQPYFSIRTSWMRWKGFATGSAYCTAVNCEKWLRFPIFFNLQFMWIIGWMWTLKTLLDWRERLFKNPSPKMGESKLRVLLCLKH